MRCVCDMVRREWLVACSLCVANALEDDNLLLLKAYRKQE